MKTGIDGEIQPTEGIIARFLPRAEFELYLNKANKPRYIDFRKSPGNVSPWLKRGDPLHWTDESYNCVIGVVLDKKAGSKLFHLLPSQPADSQGHLYPSLLHGIHSGNGIISGVAIASLQTDFFKRHRKLLEPFNLKWIMQPKGFVYAALDFDPTTQKLFYTFHNNFDHHREK